VTTYLQDDEASAERAERVVEHFVGVLEEIAGSGTIKVLSDRARLFPCAFGWWAGITRSCQALLTLHRAGLAHEGAPIVRTVLQHALALQWLIETGDPALDAIAEYGDDNTRKLIDTLSESRWPLPDGWTTPRPAKPKTPHPLLPKLTDFSQMCRPYGALQLYVPFRLLSAHAHPTSVSAMAYVDGDTGHLQINATGPTRGHLIQAAMCLIQAWKIMSAAVDDIILDDAVAKAEGILGVEVGLWTAGS
jgi:hypothetical protein